MENGAAINSYPLLVVDWQDAHAIVEVGVSNVKAETIREQVRHNCAGGWRQVRPHETNDLDCMILGGGPTLKHFLDARLSIDMRA